jgi:dTDP-4-dehydrorhamnose reductase
MKILITGADGQLGYHLKQVFADHELYLGDVHNFDITNQEVVLRETTQFQPDVIIHAAAYTNVDKAEADKDLCWKINVDGTRNVAQAAKQVNATLIAISTDYVFSGDKGEPYLESDPPAPLSYYGHTKYEAEKIVATTAPKHFICRTSWLYGGPKPTKTFDFSAPGLPKNFVYTMLRVGKNQSAMDIVSDQVGGPTYAQDLAEYVKRLIESQEYGVYHLTNAGVTNWAEFATSIFTIASYPTVVNHVTSEDWAAKNPQATVRPKYSVLGHSRILDLGWPDLRSWQDALADYLSEMK